MGSVVSGIGSALGSAASSVLGSTPWGAAASGIAGGLLGRATADGGGGGGGGSGDLRQSGGSAMDEATQARQLHLWNQAQRYAATNPFSQQYGGASAMPGMSQMSQAGQRYMTDAILGPGQYQSQNLGFADYQRPQQPAFTYQPDSGVPASSRAAQTRTPIGSIQGEGRSPAPIPPRQRDPYAGTGGPGQAPPGRWGEGGGGQIFDDDDPFDEGLDEGRFGGIGGLGGFRGSKPPRGRGGRGERVSTMPFMPKPDPRRADPGRVTTMPFMPPAEGKQEFAVGPQAPRPGPIRAVPLGTQAGTTLAGTGGPRLSDDGGVYGQIARGQRQTQQITATPQMQQQKKL